MLLPDEEHRKILDDVLAATAERDAKTCAAIADDRVRYGFWCRDADDRALDGTWT
jgi:hypothetical protein